MKETKNIHKGHRQRLKEKVKNNGISSLSKHEVLELLLTYTIPQKDTNALAHKLINQFGSFSSVLDASYEELLKADGVGHETALFLSMLPNVFEVYKSTKENEKVTTIKNTEDCIVYFRQNFEVQTNECFYLVCMNKLGKPIKAITIKGSTDHNISLNIRDITEKINSINTYAVLMYHTHPKGDVKPSDADLHATQSIINICALLNIVFCDHLIFNEYNHISLACAGYLDDMFKQVVQAFPHISTEHIRFQQKSNFEYKDVKE